MRLFVNSAGRPKKTSLDIVCSNLNVFQNKRCIDLHYVKRTIMDSKKIDNREGVYD